MRARVAQRLLQRRLVEQVGLQELDASRQVAMRSNDSVLDRRTMPKTS